MDPSSAENAERALLDLTRQVCQGTISDADRDRLEEMLVAHPELRGKYLDHVDMNARLAWRYRTGSVSTDKAHAAPDPRYKLGDSKVWSARNLATWAAVIGATAACLAGLVWLGALVALNQSMGL